MENVRIVVVSRDEEQSQRSKPGRRRTEESDGDGSSMVNEMLAARGIVLQERQNSVFSEAWAPMALLFIIVGFIASRNAALIGLGMTLLAIYGVSGWWKDQALRGVVYHRTFDRTRVFPGEPLHMTIHVSNNKLLPLTWLRFDDHLPLAPLEAGEIAEVIGDTHGEYVMQNVFALAGHGRASRKFTLVFPRRGFFELGPVSYRSGDIFTLFTIERDYDARSRVVVYPRIWPLEQLGLPAKEPFGEQKVLRSLFADPIRTQGIRDYHPRDRFRDIHWKASARRGELQTKVYDPSTGMTLAIFLNVATMHRHWMGFHPELLERAISVAASAANYGAEQKWAIGLYVNGSVPQSDQSIRVPPGRSPDQLSHILEALAATREFATASIEKLMLRESPRLPWAATLLLVTAHVSDDIGASLLRLKEAGRRVALISLADEAPPTLPGILVYHVPASGPAFAEDPASKAADVHSATQAALSAIPVPADVRREDNGEGTG
ncbi:MAG TPA: DUF58 domain-containing protein [Candidatus Binatia bacterium]|nr:DUF58 domain-containing protein [Candidatus Binatia bacterium]